MAGIGLINLDLDAKQFEPLAIIALAAVGGFFMWRYLSNQQANAQANAQAADAYAGQTGISGYSTGDLENLALAEQLGLVSGGSGGSGGGGSQQVTYSGAGGPSTSTGTTNTGGGTSTTGQSGTGTSGAAPGNSQGNWVGFWPLGNGVG